MNTQKMDKHPPTPETKESASKPVTPAERKMDPAHVPHIPGNAPFAAPLPANTATLTPSHAAQPLPREAEKKDKQKAAAAAPPNSQHH